MSTSTLSTELQLVAALSAMSEANLAMRSGTAAKPAICRAARCLARLADCPDLAPELRARCDHMCAYWEAAMAPFTTQQSVHPPMPVAKVIPMRQKSEPTQ